MALVLGFDAKLYRNSATYAAPTWNEISNVGDLTAALAKSESDVSTRGGGGWKAVKGSLKETSLEFTMVYDTSDTELLAIQAAWEANTTLDIAALSGDTVTDGVTGIRATFDVIGFDIDEALPEAMTVKVVLKPTYATYPPEIYGVTVYAQEDLAANADVVAAKVMDNAAACTLHTIGILTAGAPAGVDDSNTVVITIKDGGGNTIVTKTYDTDPQPPTSDYGDLGTLDTTHKILTAGEDVTMDVTQGTTANMPAFDVILRWKL